MERRFGGGGRRSREDRDGGCGGYTHEGQGERTRCGVEGATATNKNTNTSTEDDANANASLQRVLGTYCQWGRGWGRGWCSYSEEGQRERRGQEKW